MLKSKLSIKGVPGAPFYVYKKTETLHSVSVKINSV